MIYDLTTLAAHAVSTVLAAPPAAPTGPKINTTGVLTWLLAYVIPLMLGGIGVIMLGRVFSGHAQTRQMFQTVTQVVIALAVMAGGTALFAFASGLVHFALPG